jgi:hypothetical protein
MNFDVQITVSNLKLQFLPLLVYSKHAIHIRTLIFDCVIKKKTLGKNKVNKFKATKNKHSI